MGSSLVRKLAESHKSIATQIDDFMWEKKFKSSDAMKREYTQAELELLLYSIREKCWKAYDEAADELEWR